MMMTKLRNEDGAVAVLTAILLVVLMTMVALTVDVGGMLLRRREMVNGADAASLAAAITYVENQETTGADAVALNQFSLNSPGSVSNNPGGIIADDLVWDFNDDGSGSVTVTYTTNQPMYFAPVFGFDEVARVSTTATATWEAGSVGGGTIDLECGETQANPCAPKNKVTFCHYNGSDIGGGSGKYNGPSSSTTGTGPAGHIGHGYDVIPSYWFKQNNKATPVLYPGVNWPVLTNLPSSPVDYTWMIGMSAESFIASGCTGEGPHVWLSN